MHGQVGRFLTAQDPVDIGCRSPVFVGDVGRPDLLEKAANINGTMEVGARQLWASLERFRARPDWLQIWPGHGAGSACGKGISAIPSSTLGYERRFNWAYGCKSEAEFVDRVLAGQPELAARLNAALVEDCPLISREGGFIREGFSLELDQLRELAAGGKQWIARYQSEESQRTGIPNLKVGYNKVFGYFLEITNAHRDKTPPHARPFRHPN